MSILFNWCNFLAFWLAKSLHFLLSLRPVNWLHRFIDDSKRAKTAPTLFGRVLAPTQMRVDWTDLSPDLVEGPQADH